MPTSPGSAGSPVRSIRLASAGTERASLADGGDLSTGDNNGLITLGGRARSVNHAHMLQGSFTGDWTRIKSFMGGAAFGWAKHVSDAKVIKRERKVDGA